MDQEGGEHGGHVQQRSFAPVILSIGIFFINLGIVFGPQFFIPGILVFALGVGVWVGEDIHIFERGGHG